MLNRNCSLTLYIQHMSIGARIRQLRLANKLSGQHFGEFCEVSKGMVSQWESDTATPGIERLLMLRQHLEFSLDWLLLGDVDYSIRTMRPTMKALLKVAEGLPDEAVAKLSQEGDTYTELIELAKREKPKQDGTNG